MLSLTSVSGSGDTVGLIRALSGLVASHIGRVFIHSNHAIVAPVPLVSLQSVWGLPGNTRRGVADQCCNNDTLIFHTEVSSNSTPHGPKPKASLSAPNSWELAARVSVRCSRMAAAAVVAAPLCPPGSALDWLNDQLLHGLAR